MYNAKTQKPCVKQPIPDYAKLLYGFMAFWYRGARHIRMMSAYVFRGLNGHFWEKEILCFTTESLRRVRSVCGEIMQDFCHTLKDVYNIGANFYLLGSGARNLIVQNAAEPIDLDYNLESVRCVDFEDCRTIKACARKASDKALAMHGWGNCEDSASSLTTECRYFTSGNSTAFSIDVCIVAADEDGQMARLIHEKTGIVSCDRYDWNDALHSAQIRNKADLIKRSGKWTLVREQYLRLKNMYLTRRDRSHPSFVCYIEAVNHVYDAGISRRQL